MVKGAIWNKDLAHHAGRRDEAMGFLGNLLKKKPLPRLSDPVFGPLVHDQGFWTFVPENPGDGFMILVEAPEAGPTAAQRAFFLDIRSRLADLEQRARDFLRSHAEKTIDPSRLSVYAVEIGGGEETKRQEFVLELSDNDAFVIHRVSFRAGEPVDHGTDD